MTLPMLSRLKEICGDGVVPVPGGWALNLGPQSSVDVTGPQLPGVTQFHPGSGPLDLPRMSRFLDRQPPEALDRTVHTLPRSPGRLTLSGLGEQADLLRLPVQAWVADLRPDEPGAALPLAPHRVIYFDRHGQMTVPGQGDVVRVVPRSSRAPRPYAEVNDEVASIVAAHPHPPGRIVFSDGGVELGLPAALVNHRRPVATGLRGAFEREDVGAVGAVPVEVLDGYVELLRRMQSAAPGAHGLVAVDGAAGTSLYLGVREPHGVSFIDLATLRAALLPQDAAGISFGMLPDSLSVQDVLSALNTIAAGRSPRVERPVAPAGAGPVGPTRLNRLQLADAVRDTVRAVGSGTDQINCVALLDALKDRLYPTGVRATGVHDDLALSTGRPEGTLVPGATWNRVPSWDDLRRAVFDAGPGAAAFVLLGRRSGIGHGFALYHLADGTIVRVDVQAEPDRRIVEGVDGLEPVAATRAVVVDDTGRVVDKAFAPVVESAGPVRAQLDTPNDPRFGMSRRQPGPDSPNGVRADTPTTVEWAPPDTPTTVEGAQDVQSRPRPPRPRPFSEDSLTPRERQIWDGTHLSAAEQASIRPDMVSRSLRQRRITVILNRRRDLAETQRSLQAARAALDAAPEGRFATIAEREEHVNAALEGARQRWNREVPIPHREEPPTPPAVLLRMAREALGHEEQRATMYLVGSPRDIRTERQVYLDLAMDHVDHPRMALTDDQHREWDGHDAEAAMQRVAILANAVRRLAATVDGDEVATAPPPPGTRPVVGGPPLDGLSDGEWQTMHGGPLHIRPPMDLTLAPEQHHRAGRHEVHTLRLEIRRLSRALEDITRTDPVPQAHRQRMFEPLEPIAPGRPLARPRLTRPGRQLFRTVLATGRRELVTLAAHDEHRWPTGGRRLGTAADLDVDPVSTSEAPEMPAGINPRTNTDTSNIEEVEGSVQYEYYTVDRTTGLSAKEVLDPRERIHETKPLGGYEPGGYAWRHGRRVPVGEPRARVLTYDEGTGRWDVVPMDTRHVPSPPDRDADGRPVGSALPAPASAASTRYQVLRRDPDGVIDLLTYHGAPNVAPGPGGPGGIYQYHRLDGTRAGWHAGVIPGFPATTVRLEGTVAGQTSVALVRDTDTGLWRPVPTVTEDTAPSGTPAPPAPPRTFHRLNQTTGNLEDLPVKAIQLDVLELDLGTGAVKRAAFAASSGPDIDGLALDPLNNLVLPPATARGSLRYDPDAHEIQLHPSDDSSGGGGTFGDGRRPTGGGQWGTARPTPGVGGGSRVVTRRPITTFTRTADRLADRPAGDTPRPVVDDADTPPPTPQPVRRPQPPTDQRRSRRSTTTAGVPHRVIRTTRRTPSPDRFDEPLAGVLDPRRARMAVGSFNQVLVTHRGVAPSSLPRLSPAMAALSTQFNRSSAGDEPVANRPSSYGTLGGATPAGTGTPVADPPPLAWGRMDDQQLSSEAASVLDRRGLHAVAADEPGGVIGTVLSSGVLHRVPGMRALTTSAATVSPDSIAGMLLAERIDGGWPMLGVSIVDQAIDGAIAGWIAAGLPADAVPEPVRAGLAGNDGQPLPGAEVLVHLAAMLAGRPVDVVRSDGSQVRYGPDSTEPPMVLVADSTDTLLATVPRDLVPAVLAAEPAQVLRPGLPDDPTTVQDDAGSLDELGRALATITGVENLPLPDPEQWAAGLRTQLAGSDSVDQNGGIPQREDATLDTALAAVRDALSDTHRTLAPPHTSWPGVIEQAGDPNILNREQADALRDRGLAAVWTRPGGNALFEALRLAGRHGSVRLGNIADVPAASLRSAFGALVRAELGRPGESPLTAAERSDATVGRAAVLDFAARLATPTGVLYPETPHLLARTMTAVFGVDVEIIGPDGTPHLYQVPGERAPRQPLTLVVDANGHVMATVPLRSHPGTVRVPGPRTVQLELATYVHPAVVLEPPSDSSDLAGGDVSDLSAEGVADHESTDHQPTTDRDSLEYATDPEPGGPDGGRPGAGGEPPIDRVRPPLVLPPAHSTVHSIGIPRGTLPHVDELVSQVRAAAIARGRPIAERQLNELGQRLLGNYRQVAGGGHSVTLDGVELLITMAPSDPRFIPNPAGSYDLVAPGPSRDAEAGRETNAQGRFRANENTHGTFNTGGVSQSHTGQGTSLRGRLAVGFGFGVGPGVLQAGRFGGGIGGTANESAWTTSQFKDAESGRVESNRVDSTLIAYRPNWTVQMRSDPALDWDDVPPVWKSDGAHQDPLLVYIPDHYLGDAGPQVIAHDPGPGAPGEAEFEANQTRLPDTYFASGLTGLPKLYDNIVHQVQAGGVPMPLGSPMREELRQKLWKLDANLGTAINEHDGYRITLHDQHGQAVAVVRVHTIRSARAQRAGATSNVSHLERVRTAIVGQSASHGVKNESSAQVSGGVGLASSLGFGFSVSAHLGWTWTNSDTTNAGRTGLWVLVSRYTGHTNGYTMPLRHWATVSTVARPAARPALTDSVDGTALVRLPEPAAYAHGLPVDSRAVNGTQPNQRRIAYRPGATRDTGGRRATGGVLPRHVYDGRGIGMGLARVDDEAVTRLRNRVMTELRERGFLPPDDDRPFHHSTAVYDQVTQNMQLANLNVVTKFVSGDGLDSHFDQSLQDGLPFTLTVREPNGKLRSARVTINARQYLAEYTPPQGLVTDPEQSPNSQYYRRRTGEYHLVNLAIGTGSGGMRAGGGQTFAAGAGASVGLGLLKNVGGAVEFQRSVGASQGVGFVVNRPELLEYPGDVDEFVLPTSYFATIEYDDGTPTMRNEDDPVRAEVTVHLVPLLNTGIAEAGPAATAGSPTPREVIDQAVVYHLDTSGLLEAARTLQPQLTGVGATNDEEVNNFAGQIMQRSFLKEALGHQLQTNQLFESGLVADRHGALAVSADLGASTFVGATKDQFTLGLIKLWLAQASHTSSRGRGITVDQLDLALHGNPGLPLLTDITGEVDRSVHWGWNRNESMSRTGGKELLELDFHRAYAFATTVDFVVQGIRERGGKLVSARPEHSTVTVDGKAMVYLLAEPEALAAYADGHVPISLAQLQNALDRWQNGELTLSNNLVERILRRLMNDYGPGDSALRAWSGGIAETVEDGHRDALRAALIKAGLETPNDLWSAPYLTRTGPRALGHSGVHDFTFNDRSRMFDLVYEAVEAAAPGLLGVRQEDWAQRMRELKTQVWYRKVVPGGQSLFGRVPGGLDLLQSIMSGGREQSMLEDMLGTHGISFFLVNPIGDTLTDVVEVNLQLLTSSTPTVRDFVGGTGLENYGHAYAEQTTGTSRDSTHTSTLPKVGLAGAHHTSGGPELHFADGHHEGVTHATQNTEEQTAYDWTGEYRFDIATEFRLTVRRLDMVSRPLNNTLVHGYRSWAGHTEPVVVRRAGNLVLRVPRGLAEAQPLQGPDPVIDLSALPRLPGDSYITAALVDDALPAAEALLARVLGPVAGDPGFRSSISLPVLLSRSHLTNHLTKALAGREYLLVDNMFIPGHSSNRVSMWLSGDLYNLRVLAPIVNATGTGRYAKHQAGTNAFSNHDRLRPSFVGGVDQAAQTHLNDPANPTQAGATDTFDASTSASRVAPRGVNNSAGDNYRNETHIKQQGEVFLVEADVVLRLAAERNTDNPLLPARHQSREYSDPITGTVFLEIFADELVELQARAAAANAAAAAFVDPATWPRADRQSQEFPLDEQLINVGKEIGDVRRTPREVARRIQRKLDRPGPIRLTSQPGRRVFRAYEAVRAWAFEHLEEVDPAAATRVYAEQALLPHLELQLAGPNRAEPADVAETWTRIWDLVREVNERHTTPRALPPETALAGLDNVHTARQVARDLGRHVQLEDVDQFGDPVVHSIDPAGRVFRLDNFGEPLTAPAAYSILLDELNRASAVDPDGEPVDPARWQGRQLDEDRIRAGIDDVALYGLYRTSWSRSQTFEQAIRGAIADHDRALADAVESVDPAPPPPSPPADSDTHSVLSRRPRPRDGSFAESDHDEVLSRMASLRRRFAGHRPEEGTVDTDTESDNEVRAPSDAGSSYDPRPDVPREGAWRRPGLDSLRGVVESSTSDEPTPLTSAHFPPSQESVAVRRDRALDELGPDGRAALRERAAQIVRRITFGLADNETAASHYPGRAIESGISLHEQMRFLLPSEPFGRLQDVADALLFEGPGSAELVADGLRSQVETAFGRRLRRPAPDFDEVDPNRIDTGQQAALGRLGRYARWTPPGDDSWFASVLRAARELPQMPSALAGIDVHDPDALRALIHGQFAGAPGLSEDNGFLIDQMFDVPMAAQFLGVQIVVVDRNGRQHVFGAGSAIYLVRNGNHYMPALPSRPVARMDAGPSALEVSDGAVVDVVSVGGWRRGVDGGYEVWQRVGGLPVDVRRG
ncbi:hypothetical protein, partial [Dactylosporangium sp. NPDC048998]|uniref:hypothetical protein n=1 Tax=Dactylosporangium sp. NPDC048998 TaxID=3363976 RepID=UPI003718BBF6